MDFINVCLDVDIERHSDTLPLMHISMELTHTKNAMYCVYIPMIGAV